MAPRSRRRKIGLSRMDAAVDAMAPYGFTAVRVRKVVKQLLKEYGGDEGWPFIEEYSYKELIEAILRDVEESDHVKYIEYGNTSQDEKLDGVSGAVVEYNAVPGARLAYDVADPNCSEVDNNSTEVRYLLPADGNTDDSKDIGLDQASRQKEREVAVIPTCIDDGEPGTRAHPSHSSTLDSALVIYSPPATNRLPNRRRRPCYGWIESDEEDDDVFLYLEPAIERKPDLSPPGLSRNLS
ncbi:hypothetical protein Pfo_015237 [Paulownia fortunei]|nr:hypothetical protein Pfo_015237 [Paulownia fortunei]